MAVASTIYSVKIETNSLILHDVSGRPSKVLDFPSPVTSGSSVAVTPFGIVVTGPTVTSSRSAFLWNGTIITALPDYNSDHICHGSIYFREKLMIIGGLNTAIVETFQPNSSQWDVGVEMVSPKANFATCVLGDILYVIGGVGINGRYHDSILTFDGFAWGKLQLKTPKKLRGSGAFPVSESAMIVFGGKVEEESKRVDNMDTWLVDIQGNSVSVTGSFPTPGTFSSHQAVETDASIAVTGESAQVFLWMKAERRFAVVSQ